MTTSAGDIDAAGLPVPCCCDVDEDVSSTGILLDTDSSEAGPVDKISFELGAVPPVSIGQAVWAGHAVLSSKTTTLQPPSQSPYRRLSLHGRSISCSAT